MRGTVRRRTRTVSPHARLRTPPPEVAPRFAYCDFIG